MRLNEQFIVHISDGESLLVPTADAPFSGLVQGNKSVGAIWSFSVPISPRLSLSTAWRLALTLRARCSSRMSRPR